MKNKKIILLIITVFIIPIVTNTALAETAQQTTSVATTGFSFGPIEFLLGAFGLYAANKLRVEKN